MMSADLRQELKRQITKIPSEVMNGGVMTASLWKAKVMKANKLLSQQKVSDLDLRRILDELKYFK